MFFSTPKRILLIQTSNQYNVSSTNCNIIKTHWTQNIKTSLNHVYLEETVLYYLTCEVPFYLLNNHCPYCVSSVLEGRLLTAGILPLERYEEIRKATYRTSHLYKVKSNEKQLKKAKEQTRQVTEVLRMQRWSFRSNRVQK